MSEKKKCPCPRAEAQGVGLVSPEQSGQARDKVDIEWLVEQRVQRTLAERSSYNSGFWDGILNCALAVAILFIVFWPEIKKVTAA